MPARKTKSGDKKPPKKKAAASKKTAAKTPRKTAQPTGRGKTAKAPTGSRKAAKKAVKKTARKPAAGKKTAAKGAKAAKRTPAKAARKAPAKAPKKAAAKKTARKAPAKKATPAKAAKKATGAAKKTTQKAPAARAKPTKKETRPKATKSPKKASGKAPSTPAPTKGATKAPKRTAAKTAAPAATERKRTPKGAPTFVPPVTPVVKPFSTRRGAGTTQAPAAAPAKAGHVDAQLVSAVHYGLFAAINKTFGRFGEKMVKNAALRFLEYGYKKAWLPPSAKDPVRALNEFLSRLQTMGYAESLKAQKKGDAYVCEVTGLADWDAVHELKELHYPLLPVLLPEVIHVFLDQYFNLIVALDETELVPEKRGLRVPFTMHERQRKESSLTNLPERPASTYYDLDE